MIKYFKYIWEERENAINALSERDVDDNFINIMEVLYGILLALSLGHIVDHIQENGFDTTYMAGAFIAVGVLVRFFFAPTKNIKLLGEKSMPSQGWIMFWDVPALMVHSAIYYFMCRELAPNNLDFYVAFAYLLSFNAFWLFTIWCRFKKINGDCPIYISIWAVNNIIIAIVMFGLLIFLHDDLDVVFNLRVKIEFPTWIIFFVLAALNCGVDLYVTYPYYLRDQGKRVLLGQVS